jgi:hypothetical protein
MKITLEEYKNLVKADAPYESSLCGEDRRFEKDLTSKKTNVIFLVAAGLIEFDKEVSYELAGPFITNKDTSDEKHWATYRITDHTQEDNIRSAEQIDAHQRTWFKYSWYTYRYTNETTVVEHVLGKDWDICYVGENKCSRGQLTHQEYLKIEAFLGREKAKLLYEQALEEMNRPSCRWANATAHIELPIKLYVCGNDDSSYTKLFATREDALNFVENMSKEPCKMDLNEEMLFTN